MYTPVRSYVISLNPGATLFTMRRRIQKATNRLREHSNTPIIFCSADASPADRRRGMSAGAQAYLAKPCELQELRQTIRCLIAGARGVGAGAD
jgi:DNA-binding response OmpR family regulator